MAAAEINVACGVLGQEVELIVRDRDVGTTETEASEAAAALLDIDAILPFGSEAFDALFDRIRQARVDVALLSLLGLEAVRFNRAFTEAGQQRSCLRLALA